MLRHDLERRVEELEPTASCPSVEPADYGQVSELSLRDPVTQKLVSGVQRPLRRRNLGATPRLLRRQGPSHDKRRSLRDLQVSGWRPAAGTDNRDSITDDDVDQSFDIDIARPPHSQASRIP